MFQQIRTFLSKRLHTKKYQSFEVTPDLCRNLWQCRLKNIDLDPKVDPDTDFIEFQKYFKDPNTSVATFWDKEGKLQGFYGMNIVKMNHGKKPFVRVWFEYTFMNTEFRRRPELNISSGIEAFKTIVTNFGIPIVGVSVAYPNVFIKMKQNHPNIVTLKSEKLLPMHEHVLKGLITDYFQEYYDQENKIVKMRTLPHEVKVKGKKMQENLDEYTKLNPKWKEGYALPILFEGNLKVLLWYIKRRLSFK
jgi:hypothetical protein